VFNSEQLFLQQELKFKLSRYRNTVILHEIIFISLLLLVAALSNSLQYFILYFSGAMASVGLFDPLGTQSASPLASSQLHTKKSWPELRKAVRKSYISASSMPRANPHSFMFHQINHELRLYFLGVPLRQRANTLFYVELNSSDDPFLEWHQLLDSFSSAVSTRQLSKEEQLLLERKRLYNAGITAFDHCPAANKFAFSSSSTLFVCEDLSPDGFFPASFCPIFHTYY
jgi:hypothetical protein